MSRKIHCRKCYTNEISTINIFSVGQSTKHLYIIIYHKSGSVIEPFHKIKSPFLELKLSDKNESECSSKVRVEGNSVIFTNREIFLGPEDARICFTF